jgi:hypothetical protein
MTKHLLIVLAVLGIRDSFADPAPAVWAPPGAPAPTVWAPSGAPAPANAPGPVAVKPRLRTSVALATVAGVASNPTIGMTGAFVGGDVRVLFTRGESPHAFGIRIAGMAGLAVEGRRGSAKMYAGEIGFVFETHGFWVSPGVGVGYYREDVPAPSSSWSYDFYMMPELTCAVGYDIRLGKHVAIRLDGSLADFFASVRLQAGAGVVVRF